MIRLTLLTALFLSSGFLCTIKAQDSLNVAISDSVDIDSMLTTVPVSIPAPEVKLPEKIVPWIQSDSGSEFITNDSLLRWQIWPNWGDFYAYRKDVISYRQGTTGRVDAYDISGYNPYEQEINLEGIRLSSSITGLINYNYVPHHKIGSVYEQMGSSLNSDIELKKYYILQPISYLNYDEAKNNYRNLEFMVTQNFTERTNAEISFWDRRDGDNYPDNEVQGSQILARAYHYLNQNYQIRSIFLRNEFDMDEPFGYVVTDPATFAFDEFSSVAKESRASSNTLRRDFITGIYHRADTSESEDMGLEFTLSKDKLSLPFSTDTLSWELAGYRLSAFKELRMEKLKFKLDGSVDLYDMKDQTTIDRSGWSILEVDSRVDFDVSENTGLFGTAFLKTRSDGFSDNELGVGANLTLGNKLNFRVNASVFDRMPTIQALYWRSKNYSGNNDLKNSQGTSLFGALEMNLGNNVTIGSSGRLKSMKNDTFLYPDSTFVNSDQYSTFSGTLFGRFENSRIEIESSATFQTATYDDTSQVISLNNTLDQKIWFRNNFFFKKYAFNEAAFIKFGIRTTFSPQSYGSKLYNTGLQFWQNNSSTEVDLPYYFRMDAELSARVRAIMVLIRWENALDGLGQAGYFEASTFPMPARRLIVGIRAQFRN
ncbi:MAG: hypothetical protein RLN81_06100 [Balneolaceae bacterium]